MRYSGRILMEILSTHNRSTLPMQKRKRGRPRKLSGSSNGNDFEDDPEGGMPEEMLEVKMDGGYSGNEGSDENTNRENEDDSNNVSGGHERSCRDRILILLL